MNEDDLWEMMKKITQEENDPENEEEPDELSGLTMQCLAE